MDNNRIVSENQEDLDRGAVGGVAMEEPTLMLRRDADSMDDFEHLGHDSSPVLHSEEMTTNTGLSEDLASLDPLNTIPTSKTPKESVNQYNDDDDDYMSSLMSSTYKASEDLLDTEPYKSDAPTKSSNVVFDDIFSNDYDKASYEMSKSDVILTPKPIIPQDDDTKLVHDEFVHEPPLNVDFLDEKIIEQQPSRMDSKPKEQIFVPPAPSIQKPTPMAVASSKVETVNEPYIKIGDESFKGDKPSVTVKDAVPHAIDAEAFFCQIGLDAWFNPERLNPKVESLIYWRDPKKSGPVFGSVFVILLALTYFSLISVVAYTSLLVLTGTICFRIYKNVVQAIQKTGEGHPFKHCLDLDITLSKDKITEISEVAVAHINASIVELRSLFLVEDLVDSIKFGIFLWVLTYLGSWFNGMTLVILAWVSLFSLPKVYETNKTQIDANLKVVRAKLEEITSKVKAAIPIGKKAEEKKEQ